MKKYVTLIASVWTAACVVVSCIVAPNQIVSPNVVSAAPSVSLIFSLWLQVGSVVFIARTYCSPASLLGMPTAIRAGGPQAVGELTRYLLGLLVGYYVAAIVAVPVISAAATGGAIAWDRLAVGGIPIVLLVAAGFLIGMAMRTVWSYPLALALAYALLLETSAIARGMRSFDPDLHGGDALGLQDYLGVQGMLTGSAWGAEVLLLASSLLLVAAVGGFQRFRAGGRAYIAPLALAVLFFGGFIAWSARMVSFAGEYRASSQVCSTTSIGSSVCVAAEEQPLLVKTVASIDAAEGHLGVSEPFAYNSRLLTGQTGPLVATSIWPEGDQTQLASDVLNQYLDPDSCELRENTDSDFYMAIHAWAMRDPAIQMVAEDSPQSWEAWLTRMNDDEVRQVLKEHASEIRACRPGISRLP